MLQMLEVKDLDNLVITRLQAICLDKNAAHHDLEPNSLEHRTIKFKMNIFWEELYRHCHAQIASYKRAALAASVAATATQAAAAKGATPQSVTAAALAAAAAAAAAAAEAAAAEDERRKAAEDEGFQQNFTPIARARPRAEAAAAAAKRAADAAARRGAQRTPVRIQVLDVIREATKAAVLAAAGPGARPGDVGNAEQAGDDVRVAVAVVAVRPIVKKIVRLTAAAAVSESKASVQAADAACDSELRQLAVAAQVAAEAAHEASKKACEMGVKPLQVAAAAARVAEMGAVDALEDLKSSLFVGTMVRPDALARTAAAAGAAQVVQVATGEAQKATATASSVAAAVCGLADGAKESRLADMPAASALNVARAALEAFYLPWATAVTVLEAARDAAAPVELAPSVRDAVLDINKRGEPPRSDATKTTAAAAILKAAADSVVASITQAAEAAAIDEAIDAARAGGAATSGAADVASAAANAAVEAARDMAVGAMAAASRQRRYDLILKRAELREAAFAYFLVIEPLNYIWHVYHYLKACDVRAATPDSSSEGPAKFLRRTQWSHVVEELLQKYYGRPIAGDITSGWLGKLHPVFQQFFTELVRNSAYVKLRARGGLPWGVVKSDG